MPSLLIGPMLRHVTDCSATIFVETDAPCVVEILGCRARTFTVAGHHYALVILNGLEPGATIEYDVRLDDEQCWPLPGSALPPSVIRTLGGDGPTQILFGSCRAAAPHAPPWSLSATDDPLGHGVDSLRAHGLRMLAQPREEWPNLLLLLGDQVYADDPSPKTKKRMARRPQRGPDDVVGGFEQYTWLYHEAWQPEVERWVFSVVPSAMIFDDHDVIDDWNISAAWVRETRQLSWWNEHITGAMVSYWIYQHLGNLSPDEIRAEGMLDRLLATDDGAAVLWEWAAASERDTPVAGGYRFSYYRDIGRTRVVVVDCRNGRVLEPDRAMVDEGEWAWIDECCRHEVDHLFIATSLPVMVLGGLHGLQVWNAALCDGAWGARIARWSERLRRGLDLEDWAAFEGSLHRMLNLLDEIACGTGRSATIEPPATISVLSGDIHFSYVARRNVTAAKSRIYQLVSSPIRNSLAKNDRRVLRFALSRLGGALGRGLTRSVGRPDVTASWTLTHGPEFANEMGVLQIDGRSVSLLVERARNDDDGHPVLEASIRTEL